MATSWLEILKHGEDYLLFFYLFFCFLFRVLNIYESHSDYIWIFLILCSIGLRNHKVSWGKRCNISSHRTWLVQFHKLGADFLSLCLGLSPFPSGKCTFIGIPETEHVKILATLAGKGVQPIPRCIGFYLVPCHQPLKGPSSKCMSRCILSKGLTRSHLILLELVVFFPARIFSQVEFMNIFETNKLYNSTGGCNDCLREWVCWLLVDVLQMRHENIRLLGWCEEIVPFQEGNYSMLFHYGNPLATY